MLKIPPNTPGQIEKGLRAIERTRSTEFLTELKEIPDFGYSIIVMIGPPKSRLGQKERRFKIRLIIPYDFPYKKAEMEPVDPEIKWQPHQFRDSEGLYRNILCPPDINSINVEDGLSPYISHAYHWISDALQGKLTTDSERYEFPHITTESSCVFYVTGGRNVLEWVKKTKFGKARVTKLAKDSRPNGLYFVEKICDIVEAESLESEAKSCVFGSKVGEGFLPWIYAGSPVAEDPHRPPLTLSELYNVTDFLNLLQNVNLESDLIRQGVLVAFEVPKLWNQNPSQIIWQTLKLEGFEKSLFKIPRKGNFNKHSDRTKFPAVQKFVRKNDELKWIDTVDVSAEALHSRAAKYSISDHTFGVIGIGALGGVFSEQLSKLNPKKLVCIDNDSVEPGNVIRHTSSHIFVEKPKIASNYHNFNLPLRRQTFDAMCKDVVSDWRELKDSVEILDVLIDATADNGIHNFLVNLPDATNRILCWMYIKPGPKFGVFCIRRRSARFTDSEVTVALKKLVTEEVWQEFKSEVAGELIWPEPGCYHPTFDAPFHRIQNLISHMTETLHDWLGSDQDTSLVCLFTQAKIDGLCGMDVSSKQVRLDDDGHSLEV